MVPPDSQRTNRLAFRRWLCHAQSCAISAFGATDQMAREAASTATASNTPSMGVMDPRDAANSWPGKLRATMTLTLSPMRQHGIHGLALRGRLRDRRQARANKT